MSNEGTTNERRATLPGPEETVQWRQPRSFGGSTQDKQMMSQSEVLQEQDTT